MNMSESDVDADVVDELILQAPEGALGVLRLLPLEGVGERLDCLEFIRPKSPPR